MTKTESRNQKICALALKISKMLSNGEAVRITSTRCVIGKVSSDEYELAKGSKNA